MCRTFVPSVVAFVFSEVAETLARELSASGFAGICAFTLNTGGPARIRLDSINDQ